MSANDHNYFWEQTILKYWSSNNGGLLSCLFPNLSSFERQNFDLSQAGETGASCDYKVISDTSYNYHDNKLC